MRLADRSVIGYEALSRFPAGTGAPDAWFSMASETGLGIALEIEAVRSALGHLASIPKPLRLSINVSPETLMDPALEDVLQPHDKSRLVLEITEHSTVADYEVMGQRVLALQSQGLEFAIDDAGAGFASLRHILHLVPDVIKLDISLTRRIDHDKRRQMLVSAILSFAHGTSTRVVVEGIETEGELDALVTLGVEFGQGYYLGRPEALPPP
jgi:EAL domain-containing protein (putative c-di-GMP-specific phosphodiesterase class I)